MEVRTRFAPSPTGFLHLGGARSAIFNYLFTKKNSGKFILRIEDTDIERSKKECEEDIIKSLKWLGIEWDEFYRQSERKEIYKSYLNMLLENGNAYISKEGDGTQDKKDVIRFRNPGKKIKFQDLIRGEVEMETEDLGNFVIAKDELSPLYHFAAVVDDAEMKITHVIRGEDHIPNTPRQILIQEALGFERPHYAHLPLILGSDRSKLSKRHGAKSTFTYAEEGYLPEAFFNFLALLGWHPADDKEILSREELINIFELKRVQKGGAVCDFEKLNWFNREYIKKLSARELSERVKVFMPAGFDQNRYDIEKVVNLARERMNKLSDIVTEMDFIFKLPAYDKELLKWRGKEDSNKVREVLEYASGILNAVPPEEFSKNNIEKLVMPYADEKGRGEVLWPLRVSLSGKMSSPGPFDIIEVLRKEETLRRIREAIEKIQ
ncbi:glutamate--tRNA ligase [Candidatus Giovannonibacteria bacterium]|nr:glutamate--tRNA ligase [Candidatus Giovannonibacteria bacterium]